MADPISVTVRRFDSAGFAVRLHCKYTPGSPAKGPSFECAGGEPEDPDDIAVVDTKILDAGCDVAEVLRDYDGICDAVREAVQERDEAAQCWAEDRAGEART